jgi:hypothetical protein
MAVAKYLMTMAVAYRSKFHFKQATSVYIINIFLCVTYGQKKMKGNLSNPLELCLEHFTNLLCQPGGISKDPTVWLDGARPPPR